MSPVPDLSPRALAERLARGDSLSLLDVREPVERSFCAIGIGEDTVDLHVPMGQVTASLEAIRAAASGRPLVVYCHHGVRSRMAAEWLARQGVADVWNLEGGIDAWSRAVDPEVRRY